jgi:eukaryotic-like serine/threonine-protein kinase
LIGLGTQKPADRRVLFRQALAALARSASEEGPGPLEGIRPEALVKGVAIALEENLFDDLDWLDPGPAGCALYQLAAALPVGAEQRDLGRRVLSRLLAGNAATFAAISALMARAGGKGLTSPPVFARVSLLVELPLALGVNDGALALGIASRRQLARDYVQTRSTRSLSERRLAARLLERAAREAVRRASLGDRSALRLVGPDGPLEAVHKRLFMDREPLVWRHVAVARGILLPFWEAGCVSLEEELGPSQTPTEWRRAAAALGGVAVSKPDLAVRLASRAFREGLIERDPGAIVPFVLGLARAAESEPEAAEELFSLALAGPAEDLAEATIALRRDVGEAPLFERKIPEVLARLQSAARPATDDGAVALRAELLAALDPKIQKEHGLYDQLDGALTAFATEGARAAHERGLALFEATKGAVDALLAVESEGDGSATSAMARRASFAVVRELDSGLLENSILSHLLHLDNRPERVRAHEETLDKLRDRIFGFVLDREVVTPPSQESDHHVILHLGRLRALLHLLDSDAASRADDALGEAPLARWRTAARELEAAFARGPIPALRRALMATFARSLDALTRAGACDVADAVLVSTGVFPSARDLATVGEASMDPDFRAVVGKVVDLVRSLDAPVAAPVVVDSLLPPASTRGEPNPFLRTLLSLLALTDALAEVGTARADALRSVLVRLHHAAHVISSTSTLRELALAGAEADVVVGLENATHALAQIHAGARARATGDVPEAGPAPAATRTLSSLVSRVIASGETLDPAACAEASRSLTAGVPAALAALVTAVATAIAHLRPADGSGAEVKKTEVAPAAELPPWLPPRRTLGAFYVERPLGTGGVGSVFVVTRVEDRHDREAERFALKVPDYNENAARHLSEAQFLSHFRAEATALMALPPHPSLARFVSFDLAARPKPILVMELVEGPSLERLVDTQSLDVPKAVKALGEVLDGLAAMHEVGVGHLDLKPANVVLRGGDTAVLVDFGLAGKNLRPGCGSAPYAPPEIWGASPKDAVPTPMAADVYGFACLAFELLTGDLLMEGETEVALVSSHLSHDGLPPRLREMTRDPRCVEIAELLFAALRKLPQARIGVAELKAEWEKRAPRLAKTGIDWPIQ